MKNLTWLAICSALAIGGRAHAQAQLVPTADLKSAEKTDVRGWVPFLGLTSTLTLTSNANVVGQVDGFSTMFGLGITGGADYTHDQHVLRSTLSISESFARTPVIDEFVKTNDVVKLEGIYSHFETKTYGEFGRLTLQTSAFPATDVRGVPTSWVEKPGVMGDPVIPLNSGSFRQRLASALHPFTISEAAGGFAEPIRKECLTLSLRLGAGGRSTFANGVLLIDDDKATPEVELLRLSNVHQLGVEAFAGAAGKMKGGKVDYHAGLSVLMPFVNNDAFDRSATSLTRVGFEGAVTFNMYSWMSLVYNLTITRDPQLFPKDNELTQVQNNLLLTFQFTLVKKAEKPKEPTKEELALKAAQDRADTAEKRALDAEQKLENLAVPPPAPPTPPADPTPPTPPTP